MLSCSISERKTVGQPIRFANFLLLRVSETVIDSLSGLPGGGGTRVAIAGLASVPVRAK